MLDEHTISRTHALPDGNVLFLDTSRWDERQARLRLVLPDKPTAMDYAPLIDVMRREPGFEEFRFTGQSVKEWLQDLRTRGDPQWMVSLHWYQAMIRAWFVELPNRDPTPLNCFTVDVATPPWRSVLLRRVRALRLKQASVGQWAATLQALVQHGVKSEELELSDVERRLHRLAVEAVVTEDDVVGMIDLARVAPRLMCESHHGFEADAGWRSSVEPIDARRARRHGLVGGGRDPSHALRFRHASMGWSIVLTQRPADLLGAATEWWSVLDERGRWMSSDPSTQLNSLREAMAFADAAIAKRFTSWSKNHALDHWREHALPGGDDYRELLLVVDAWQPAGDSGHFAARNVVVHVRCSRRSDLDGNRLLYLDEVQSDWHAAIHRRQQSGIPPHASSPRIPAPFRREWPLLAMKSMLWWAQRLGLDGLAWSSPAIQANRWIGNEPPRWLYRRDLPVAAAALAKVLGLRQGLAKVSIRDPAIRIEPSHAGWIAVNSAGRALCSPMATQSAAEVFSSQRQFGTDLELPTLWLSGLPPITSIPLYGVGTSEDWLGDCEAHSH